MKWDSEANRLDITATGKWDLATAQRYQQDCVAAAAKATRPGFTTVIDLLDYPPQPPEIQTMLQGAAKALLASGCIRVALVVGSPTLKLQAKRVVTTVHAESGFVYAASRAEALAALSA